MTAEAIDERKSDAMLEKPNIDAGFSRLLPEDLTGGSVGPKQGKVGEQQGNRKSVLALAKLQAS